MVPPVVVVSEELEADHPGPGPVRGRLPAHDARAALCGLPELPPAEGTAERRGAVQTGRGLRALRGRAGEMAVAGLSSCVWRAWSQVWKGERSRGPWKGGHSDEGCRVPRPKACRTDPGAMTGAAAGGCHTPRSGDVREPQVDRRPQATGDSAWASGVSRGAAV